MDLSIPLANSNCRDQYRNARSSTACSAGTGISSGNKVEMFASLESLKGKKVRTPLKPLKH
jgi:hypothetical protein